MVGSVLQRAVLPNAKAVNTHRRSNEKGATCGSFPGNVVACAFMTIHMNDNHITSVAQLAALLKAAESLGVNRVKRHDSNKEVYT